MFTIICCINNKFYIGKDNKLLYHIKDDMANFKKITSGNVVIMGRNTFESLPNKVPLPNRINIIITSDKSYHIKSNENAYIVSSIEDAIDLCKSLFTNKKWFVIGGASIYKQFLSLNMVDEMILTVVDDNMEGDVKVDFFEEPINNWSVDYESEMQTDKKTNLKFNFLYLKK